MTRIHIACSARNAGCYLDEFMDSLGAQTHGDWVLWIRDDGSSDDTWARIARWRARESRIAWCERGAESLGLVRAYGRVLAQLPRDAEAIATADADDVWMPHRLERTLAVLVAATADHPGATLVHSDLVVVDSQLNVLAPSFWSSEGIDPAATSIRSLAIQNVAVSPTLLFNGALLAELNEIPPEATHQDWWIALVAAVTGGLVAVAEPTVWYRQHGANMTGARLASWWTRLTGAYSARAKVKRDLDCTARQAGALAARYGARLPAADLQGLQGLASIASKQGWARRAAIVRWRWFAAHGVLRNLGVVLRG